MTATAAAAKTILIADDTAFVRDRFKTALQNAGHRALAVKSAAELLARVRADLASIDLLIVNLRLPHAAGAELVRAVRRLDNGKLPVVVFSGTISGSEQVRELATLGVAGYVNEYSAPHHILPSLAPHLFPDNFNRRTSPRVTVGIPVAYRFADTIATAMTLDVGKGGVSIRTMNPLEASSKVRVRFRLPGSSRDIDADARVVWSDRRVGMGLQFDHIDPADQLPLDDFVDSQFFMDRKR